MKKMFRLLLISGLSLTAVTGCATTSHLLSFADADTPMQQVLKDQPEISKAQHNISIQQVFNQVESPSVSRITVIQTGLQDDSVAAQKTEYLFKLDHKKWQLQNKQQSYRCARGKGHASFQSQLCS